MIRLLRAKRDFRLLYVGQTVSLLGDPLLPFALAFASLRQGGVATFGWLLAARSAGALLFTAAGGIAADERRQNRVMGICDLSRLCLVLGVGVSLAAHQIAITLVLVFMMSALGAFFQPALSAAVPRLVDSDDLQAANSMIVISQRAGALLGPALGGLLAQVTNAAGILAVDAATFAVSSTCFLLVRMDPVPSRRGVTLTRKLQEGIRAVRGRRWLALMISLAFVQLAFCLAPWLVLLPITLSQHGYPPYVYGTCLSVFAFGNITGALLGGRVRPRQRGTVAQLAVLPFGLLLLVIGHDAQVLWLLLAAHFVAGAGIDLYSVLWETAIQQDVEESVRGRVFALDAGVSAALMPAAYAVLGILGSHVSAAPILIIGGFVGLAISVVPLVDPQVRAYATPRSTEVSPLSAGAAD